MMFTDLVMIAASIGQSIPVTIYKFSDPLKWECSALNFRHLPKTSNRRENLSFIAKDTVVSSLPSPLYEDVTDPAFKLSNLYRINGMTKTFRVGLNAFDIVDNGQTVKYEQTCKHKDRRSR